MKIIHKRPLLWACGAAAVGAVVILSGCSSSGSGKDMTSFSARGTAETPQLFTIPADQMSHVQVVTVEPGKLTRTLRLTGSVAFNAFKTTPVITQVGGPVSRILVVPGESVREGQPLLEVSSPDKNPDPRKTRLQLAISEIMNGYLLLDEAVAKYDVPASSIIQGLKKIQKLKKEAAQLNQQESKIIKPTLPKNAK